MTPMLIAPADLAPALSGGPSLLVLPGIAEPAALEAAGLDLWLVGEAGPGGPALLHRPGGAPPRGTAMAEAAAAVPLGFAPMGAVAILAPSAEAAGPLLRWWQAATDAPPPPLVLAADGRGALAALAPVLAQALRAVEARTADLHAALAATRAEYEETRIAMAAVTRVLGQRPVAGLRSLLATRPSQAGLQVGAAAGQPLLLAQTMGVAVRGLAALALHLADSTAAGETGLLRVRLLGAESGRVLGAWDLPGAALLPGWLMLELPSPIGPVAETARLTLEAELGPEDRLAFTLDDMPTGPGTAVAGPDLPGEAADRALALKLWTSEFGNRFVAARHWCWDEAGLELPVEATPFVLPAAAWAEARVVSGHARLLALGEEAPRPVASLAGREEALVVLPLPAMPGAEVLRLDLTLQLGEPGHVRAAAWLLPAGAALRDTADLGAALRWSGWRGFGEEDGRLGLSMSLPRSHVPGAPPRAHAPGALQLAVLLRGEREGEQGSVEITGLAAMPIAASARPADAVAVPAPPRLDGAGPAAPGPRAAIAAVRLNEQFRGEGGYEHLDISVVELEAGPALRVPELRFKLLHAGGPLGIEFRRAEGWPRSFDQWREVRADEWGSIFEFSAASAAEVLAGMPGSRDGLLMQALLGQLPAVAASAARAAGRDRNDVAAWVERARIFADKVVEAVFRTSGEAPGLPRDTGAEP